MKSVYLVAAFLVLVAVLFRYSEKDWEGPPNKSQNY
jgi:hypothetical protein